MPSLGHTSPRLSACAAVRRSANLDVNGDGAISNEELRGWLVSKFKYSDEQASKIFAGIDFDASGCIDAKELRKAFVKFPALRTAPGMGGLTGYATPRSDATAD